MALWGKTSAAICKGWGSGPFVVNPPVVHPEYYFGGPYGTIPYKGGGNPWAEWREKVQNGVQKLRNIRQNYDRLRIENRRLQQQLQQLQPQQGGRLFTPRLIGGDPATRGPGFRNPLKDRTLIGYPTPESLRNGARRLTIKGRKIPRRMNTLKQGFDLERMRDQMRDAWKSQQVESETTLFDNPEETQIEN